MSNDDYDDLLTKEVVFDHFKIDNDEDEKYYKELLLLILSMWKTGDSFSKIKKRIVSDTGIEKHLETNLNAILDTQHKIITGESSGFDTSNISPNGLTFDESYHKRVEGLRVKLIGFAFALSRKFFVVGDIARYLKKSMKSYRRGVETFWRTQAKSAREYSYAKEERGLSGIKGWLSVPVLDNRTSDICIRYAYVFFEKSVYKLRTNVPERPPRHPNCRSILVRIMQGDVVSDFVQEDLQSVLKRNARLGNILLGSRYKDFLDGNFRFRSYLDIRGRKYYTKEETFNALQ